MPLYYFNLKDGRTTIPDLEGTDLGNSDLAREHAIVIAREAMRNNETRVRNWRIQVCDAEREPCFEILFAAVDESIDHLPGDIRRSLVDVSRNFASLSDAIHDVRMTLLQVRATLARSEGAPHLVALNGAHLWKQRP